MSRLRRSLAVSLTLALVLGALVVAPIANAAVVFTFWVTINASYVSGTGPANTSHTITLYTSGGDVRARASDTSDSSGNWSVSFPWYVNAGDKIRARASGSSRTTTVPNLTIRADRAGDIITGKAPASKPVVLSVTHYTTFDVSSSFPQTVAANASGNYSWDTTAFFNLTGGDSMSATYTNTTTSDTFRVSGTVPYMTVQRANHYVSGYVNAYQTATLTLKTSANVVRGIATAAGGPSGSFGGYFGTASGGGVSPRVTDKVSGSFSGDANITVPDIQLSGVASTDAVTGKCMASRSYMVYAQKADYSDYVYRYGTTDGSGNLTEDLTADINIAAGDTLQLTCKYAAGDRMYMSVIL